jgi:hypothetical protein
VSTCPCCGQNDSVQRVEVVVDSQTDHSAGGAVSLSPGSGFGGIIPSLYSGQSMSALAQRLSPRTMCPGNISLVTFAFGLIALTVYFASQVNNRFVHIDHGDFFVWCFSTFLCIPFGLIAACVVGVLIHSIYWLLTRKERQVWYSNWATLNDCWYCFRDDVVFDENNWGRPEDFVNWCFS